MHPPADGHEPPSDVVLPRWAGVDMLALSFVPRLPRVPLFTILHGFGPPGADKQGSSPAAGTEPEIRGTPLPAVREGGDPLKDLLEALGQEQASATAATARRNAAAAVARARERGIATLAWLTPRYPPLVASIFDPPFALWIKGSVDVLSAKAVAIVGSRACSPYGEDAASRLACDLARSGLVIVSGLARGIDAAAHRGAIEAGGRTIGVLGCGADVVYPPEHSELTAQVAHAGAIVTEFPPGTRPHKGHFPRRNRIISALSLGVVVVEARQRSGALITADCALEQGREVMAVPGNVLSERHRGSHSLLKAGAALVETADDVLAALGLGGSTGRPAAGAPEDPLLAAMEAGESYAIDALSAACGCEAAELLPRLLELELQGLVHRVAGGRFVRSGGTC